MGIAHRSHARGRFGIGAVIAGAIAALDAFGRETLFSQMGVAIKAGGPAAKALAVVDSVPALVYAVIAILLGLVWCFYPSLTKFEIYTEPSADEGTASERERKQPALFAYIRYIGKGRAKNDDTPLFLAQIEIRNDGFPSVVKDFCPAVTLNGREFFGHLAETADTVRLTMPNGIVKVFHEKDALYNVTKTPIEPGDVRAGHLHFYFDKAIGDVDKHLVKIYFRDYRNTTFSTEPIDAEDTVSAQSLPHPAGMFSREQYLPAEDITKDKGGGLDG